MKDITDIDECIAELEHSANRCGVSDWSDMKADLTTEGYKASLAWYIGRCSPNNIMLLINEIKRLRGEGK